MASIESELDYLLDDICVDWGFCLHADARHRISSRPSLDATSFAAEVLRAEGFEKPEYETKWMSMLARRFEERFGRSDISLTGGS